MADLDIDPLALELTEEINSAIDLADPSWEHEELSQVRIKSLHGHTAGVTSCQFCHGDARMLTASRDGTLALWEFASGARLRTYEGHAVAVTRARASADTTRICSGGLDKKLHVWDLETGAILWSGQHGGVVTCVNFSHQGDLVVSASDLDYAIKVWDVRSGKVTQEPNVQHTRTPTSAQFDQHDGRIITTAMDHTTRFWDRTSATCTLSLGGHVNVISDASCSTDERKLVTVSWDKSVALWDISTGGYRSQGPTMIEKAHEGSISSCHLSLDGAMLVTGGYDQTVALWDVESMVQKLRLQGHTDWVEDVCYSESQKWIMSCSRDKTVRLWNVEESDKVPLVLENRKAVGLKMFKCSSCGKPFSLNQSDGPKDSTLCVFCRLQVPNRN